MKTLKVATASLLFSSIIAVTFGLMGCGDKKPAEKDKAGAAKVDLDPKTPEGQLELAYKYYLGTEVPVDHKRAAELFKIAAEKNNSEAQFALGVCYQNGHGVAINYLTAAQWYLKSARQDNPNGQYLMGLSFKEGSGVAKSAVESYKWLHLAAEHGNPAHIEARDQLALLLTPDLVAEGKRRAEQFRIYERAPQSVAESQPSPAQRKPAPPN